MIPSNIREYASLLGFDELDEITLRSGEKVYLVKTNGVVGLPMYLHNVDGIVRTSTYEESMRLFNEPEYTGEQDG